MLFLSKPHFKCHLFVHHIYEHIMVYEKGGGACGRSVLAMTMYGRHRKSKGAPHSSSFSNSFCGYRTKKKVTKDLYVAEEEETSDVFGCRSLSFECRELMFLTKSVSVVLICFEVNHVEALMFRHASESCAWLQSR